MCYSPALSQSTERDRRSHRRNTKNEKKKKKRKNSGRIGAEHKEGTNRIFWSQTRKLKVQNDYIDTINLTNIQTNKHT